MGLAVPERHKRPGNQVKRRAKNDYDHLDDTHCEGWILDTLVSANIGNDSLSFKTAAHDSSVPFLNTIAIFLVAEFVLLINRSDKCWHVQTNAKT